jgi:serine/tyrosine/threonine adenylyltransferase
MLPIGRSTSAIGAVDTVGGAANARSLGPALLNSYADLPARFYTPTTPTPVKAPRLIKFNGALAAQLGIHDGLDVAALAEVFSGNRPVMGSRPIAMAYAGHQFGQFVPQLGDGRAILLGELMDLEGRRRDVQLKGSGRTAYSRGGDGRAALGPVLREYVVSEAMHALGLPTTRALAAVTTGESVFREGGALPGAIVTRVAASHIRVGTFQYFAARGDDEGTQLLADYVIRRHYPHIVDAESPYLELLRVVTLRQAQLVAGWMSVGFIHGVMNTDNMTVSGETIDFGPCAFMDEYDPATVFSSIDRQGRYAYGNQPAAAQWNLARFAETLLPLIHAEANRAVELATAVIEEFSREFAAQWLARLRGKLGLFTEEEGDEALAQGFLDSMQANHSDFTLSFRRLSAAAEGETTGAPLDASWMMQWRARIAREPQPAGERAAFMRRVNPAFIPRNHRIEAAIVAAVEHENFAPFEELTQVLSRPYEEQLSFADYADPPQPEERVLQTFCGT